LRRIVHALRAALGDGAIATHLGGGYRSTIARGSLDVTQLEHALARARQHDMDRASAVSALQHAINATAGEPLGGLALANPALNGLARSMSELRIAAEDALVALLLMSGLASAAISLLEELVSATPLHEERWALLMTALAATGRRSDALRCYQRARDTLIDTVGARALPGPHLTCSQDSIAEQSVVPGTDHPVWVGDVESYLAPIRSFLRRHGTSPADLVS
jgi:DNA-binding SARP family transcriptional activator